MRLLVYLSRFRNSFSNPLKVQEKVLNSILKANRGTVYGKKYCFSDIKSISDFQKTVPLITYKDISSYVERMKLGEKAVLTSYNVDFFCKSSGTSGEKKFLPVTEERIAALKAELAVRGIRARKAFKSNWKAIFGKILYICASYQEGYTEANIPYGSISGYLGMHAPKFTKAKYAIPVEVFGETDYNKKLAEMSYYALLEDIEHLGFTTTIEILLIFDYIEKHSHELLERIEKTHPRRAEYLKNLPEMSPKYIWPKIRLANCFLTNTTLKYKKELEMRLGRTIHMRDAGINASEGRISLGVCEDDISGLPVTFNTFFEFIEKDDSQRILTLESIKAGKRYEVVLTTYEGLYRYRTGDIVEVTGFEKNLPTIKFQTRENHLDVVGELSPEADMVAAFYDVVSKHNISINEFTFLPWYPESNDKPRYEVLIEPSKNQDISEAEWKVFAQELDDFLQERIYGYYKMRKMIGRMDGLVISLLSSGSWEKYNKKRIVTVGQPKHIHLHTDAGFKDNFSIEKTIM